MGKTKTFGVRLAPELITELERLRAVFAFGSYGEMMENLVRVLQGIDEDVCRIEKHPREWNIKELEEYFSQCGEHVVPSSPVDSLMLRRLRERFGEDGVQRVQVLLQGPETKMAGPGS